MIPIPQHLLVFNPDDWPGKQPGHTIGIDILIRREHWRRGQDQWSHSVGIWRDTFEDWQRAQLDQQADTNEQ